MKTSEELFWAKVDKRRAGECWPWMGYRQRFGHGSLMRKGKTILAHRFAWELHKGKIGKTQCVLHKCDRPACVNPRHLYLGSRADNAHDAARKMRHTHGEKTGSSKLTEENVREIRRLKADGWTGRRLAEKFGLSLNHVYGITARRLWKHLNDQPLGDSRDG